MRGPDRDDAPKNDQLLRLREVLQIFPVSRSAWYKGISQGRYPRGIKLSIRAIAWRRTDIEALVRSLSERTDAR